MQDMELMKAVAQAWHAQTGNPKPTAEFDTQKGCPNFRPRPTRFKLEAAARSTAAAAASSRDQSSPASARWDFGESLLDSYEIVSLSRKLEADLSLDLRPASVAARATKRRRESKHSLRSLFSMLSSNRN